MIDILYSVNYALRPIRSGSIPLRLLLPLNINHGKEIVLMGLSRFQWWALWISFSFLTTLLILYDSFIARTGNLRFYHVAVDCERDLTVNLILNDLFRCIIIQPNLSGTIESLQFLVTRFFHLHLKHESGSESYSLRLYRYLSFISCNKLSTNMQTKPNAFWIQLSRWAKFPKLLEKLILVMLRDAFSWVFDTHL